MILPLLAFSQVPEIDTIYVNQSGITMIFPKEVIMGVVGLPTDYSIDTKGSLVKFNAKKEKTRLTSLTIEYGDNGDVFTTILKYRENVENLVYNFKKQASVVDPLKEEKRREQMALDDEKLRVRKLLDELLDKKDEIKTLGVKEGSIVFNLSAVRLDNNYTYFMFLLDNQSKFDFKLDYIRFQALDKVKQDESLTDNKDTDIKVFVNSEIEFVKRGTKEYLLYAIPTFGTSSKGGYKITLKEKTGNRKPVLIVKSKFLDSAKLIGY